LESSAYCGTNPARKKRQRDARIPVDNFKVPSSSRTLWRELKHFGDLFD